MSVMAAAASVWLFPLLMILAATEDVLSRRIPNGLNLLIAIFFLPLAWASGMPLHTIILHAACGAGVLGLGFALFSLRWLGGGDAKLLAAAAVWFGLEGLATFLTTTALAGGLLALVMLAWSAVALDIELRELSLARPIRSFTPSLPYGYAIAAGAILAFAEGGWTISVIP
jgi:prepilin peptidase CpaA